MRISDFAVNGSSHQTVIPNDGRPPFVSEAYYSARQGFNRPDGNTISPLINGYRKPTAYRCTAYHSLGYKVPIIEYFVTANGRNSSNWQHIVDERTYGFVPANLSPVVASLQAVRTKVRNDAAQERMDIAMSLAEAGDTAQTAVNLVSRVGRSMKAIKDRDPTSFEYLMNGRRSGRKFTDRNLRQAASTFLEWKYGIMPTVYDLQAATAALDDAVAGNLFEKPTIMTARARDVATRTTTVQGQIRSITGVNPWPMNVIQTNEISARLDYRVRGDMLRGLNRFGIGLGTIPTLLFERTPFAFVFNMAVPIASTIKAWSALAGVDVLSYCETNYSKYEVSSSVATWYTGGNSSTGVRVTATPGATKPLASFDRQVFGAPPMPTPYIRNPIKVNNVATVLALFTQLRK